MARKKATKKTKLKRTASKGTTKIKGISASTGAMEKHLRALPAQLMTLLRKDATGLNLQAKKLQGRLKKVETQQATTDNRLTALSAKTPLAGAGKKRLNVYKKSLATTSKTITGLNKQLMGLEKLITTLTLKQEQYSTLQKQLTTLDKQLKAQLQKATKNTAPKKSSKKSTTTGPSTTYGNTMSSQDERIVPETTIETME
jgi:chromosome segregation ATPase